MMRRRAFCIGFTAAVGGCVNAGDVPRKFEAPPIDGSYLRSRNALRLSHGGESPLINPEQISVEVVPGDTTRGESGEFPARLEVEERSTDNGLWVATNGEGVTTHPLEPGDAVTVTGYNQRGTNHGFEPGDHIQLAVVYEERLQHFGVMDVPPEPTEE